MACMALMGLMALRKLMAFLGLLGLMALCFGASVGYFLGPFLLEATVRFRVGVVPRASVSSSSVTSRLLLRRLLLLWGLLGLMALLVMRLFPAEGKWAFWPAFKNHFGVFPEDGRPPRKAR